MATNRLSRIVFFMLNALTAFCLAALYGCDSGSNEPSITGGTMAGTGGTMAGTGGTVTGGTGGTIPSTGGTTTVTGGAGGTETSTGGTETSTGGTETSTGGTETGAGGSEATDGSTTTDEGGAATDASGADGAVEGEPHCEDFTTAAGEKPGKNINCTEGDIQLCYKACGPETKKYVGYKSETCTNGVYVEQSGCTFPAGVDYSCYKIPETMDATCPTTVPQATQECSVAACVVCNVGGKYLTSGGEEKDGYCVCPEGGEARKWSCASTTAWPCPTGQGC
ncbi:MAG: hypothetical protein JXA30_16010 [Deltaproteobacteria bacterium]|nr:hypothetical protein [Deltaproteobacteria bacterium]